MPPKQLSNNKLLDACVNVAPDNPCFNNSDDQYIGEKLAILARACGMISMGTIKPLNAANKILMPPPSTMACSKVFTKTANKKAKPMAAKIIKNPDC